jgi:hypothetical protein
MVWHHVFGEPWKVPIYDGRTLCPSDPDVCWFQYLHRIGEQWEVARDCVDHASPCMERWILRAGPHQLAKMQMRPLHEDY